MTTITKWTKILQWGWEFTITNIIDRTVPDLENPKRKISFKCYTAKWDSWEIEIDEQDVILWMNEFLKTKTNR